MEYIDKRTKQTLIVLWIITLIVALIGATFGYFTATSKTDPQIITTRTLTLDLVIEGTTKVDNIKPTTWDTNMTNNESNNDIVKIPFRMKSTSGVEGIYSIKMNTKINENTLLNGGSASDIKYKLYKDNIEIKSGDFNIGDFSEVITTGDIIKNNKLNDEYKLYIYIEDTKEDQNKLQNITFGVTLIGEATQKNA